MNTIFITMISGVKFGIEFIWESEVMDFGVEIDLAIIRIQFARFKLQ